MNNLNDLASVLLEEIKVLDNYYSIKEPHSDERLHWYGASARAVILEFLKEHNKIKIKQLDSLKKELEEIGVKYD